MAKTKLQQLVEQYLAEHCLFDEHKHCWFDEAYVDYDSEIGAKAAADILQQYSNPKEGLEDLINDSYDYDRMETFNDHIDEFKKTLERKSWSDEDIEDMFNRLWYLRLPFEHYMSQEVCINIIIDTGDKNYDYSLNATYPHYNGVKGEEIDDKASLVWLAQQQGYSKEQLQDVLTNGEDAVEQHGFLPTVFQEVINCCVPLPRLIFPVKMTLKQACELNKIINKRDKAGDEYEPKKRKYEYEPEKRKDVGTVILDKSVEPLLYDSWGGGGSVWGIELDKDVEIPIKYIESALPDEYLDYSIHDCYGCTDDCWKPDVVKEIKNN